jgi:hypothetical protein
MPQGFPLINKVDQRKNFHEFYFAYEAFELREHGTCLRDFHSSIK